jgi:ferric-dicitrate binding protein FerR (iron transport regulator)
MLRTQGIIVAILLACLAPPSAAQGEDAAVAEVAALTGTATVVRAASSEPLAEGDWVREGDTVVTGADSRVRLTFVDGSIVALGAASEFSVERYAAEGGSRTRGFFELLRGILRATVAPGPRGSFGVVTPTAVISVRSTDWIGEATDANTAVFVAEGSVIVAATPGIAGRPVVLAVGEGTDVAAGALPKAPVRWGEARVADVIERTSVP